MKIRIEKQNSIMNEVKKGYKKGILDNHGWEYIETPEKKFIWWGKGISNVTNWDKKHKSNS